MQLERRGFYPKGRGHMSLAVRCLAPGAKLPAFNLTQSGNVRSIRVHAFAAGKLRGGSGAPPRVAERMVASAVGVLRQVNKLPTHEVAKPLRRMSIVRSNAKQF